MPESRVQTLTSAMPAAGESRLNGDALERRFQKDVAGWFAGGLRVPPAPAENAASPATHNERILSRAGFLMRVFTRVTFCWFLREMGVLPKEWFSAAEPRRIDSLLRSAVPGLPGPPDCFDEFNPVLAPELLFGNTAPKLPASSRRKPRAAGGLIDILSRYRFGVAESPEHERSHENLIDPALLGTVFENLLASSGEPGRLTSRRAAGAFYTPRVIVDYMVAESVRDYLAVQVPDVPRTELEALFQTPAGPSALPPQQRAALVAAIGRVRILDPACGAGAFLLGALQRLVNLLERLDPHHELWKSAPLATTAAAGEMTRTFDTRLNSDYARKKYLIANCLHGVDIQPLACEIAGLRLWLALHCTQACEPLQFQNDLGALPPLSVQIRVADALLVDGIPTTGNAPAFDIVLCNPPYRKERDGKALFDQIRQSAWGRQYHIGKMDYWYFFLHRALELTRADGIIAFITSRYWLAGSGTSKLIPHIRAAAVLTQIVDIGKLDLFDDVAGQHLIHFYRRIDKTGTADSPVLIKRLRHDLSALAQHSSSQHLEISSRLNSALFTDGGSISLSSPQVAIVSAAALGERYLVSQGVVQNPDRVSARAAARFNLVRNAGVFVVTPDELPALGLTEEELVFLKPFYDESEISRYALTQPPRRFLFYLTRDNCPSLTPYPNLERHLRRFEPIMSERRETRQGTLAWFHLHWPRAAHFFEGAHILFPNMFRTPLAALTDQPAYVGMGSSVIITRDPAHSLGFLTVLLNSEVAAHWFRENGKQRGVGVDVGVQRLRDYPLPSSTPSQRDIVENIAGLLRQTSVAARNAPPRGSGYVSGTEAATLFGYLEQVLNGLVYELYFPDDLHTGGLRLFEVLDGIHWPVLDASSSPSRPQELRDLADSLTASAPVHRTLHAIQSLEIVRKIRD